MLDLIGILKDWLSHVCLKYRLTYLKALSHSLHLYGASPVCFLLWTIRAFLDVYFLLHCSQSNVSFGAEGSFGVLFLRFGFSPCKIRLFVLYCPSQQFFSHVETEPPIPELQGIILLMSCSKTKHRASGVQTPSLSIWSLDTYHHAPHPVNCFYL